MELIGLDPGGSKSFGWALLRIDGAGVPEGIRTGLCTYATDALRSAAEATRATPAAIGIDAPLYWVEEGDRLSDKRIRTSVCARKGKSGTVGHVNSLRGACLVQGVLAARLAAQRWPSALVTEAHPKALRLIHRAAQSFLDDNHPNAGSEHERDAVLAAFAAWCAIRKVAGWRDLVRDERAPYFPGGHEVTYWFPVE